MLDTPSVSPSGAIVGMCEIIGKASTELDAFAKLKPLIKSPIMNTDCVWYEVIVEEYVQKDDSKEWKKIFEKKPSDGFRIVDGYGGIFINASHAKKYLTKSTEKNKSVEAISKAKYLMDGPVLSSIEQEVKKWQTSPDGFYMYHVNVGKYIPTTYVSPDKTQFFDDTKQVWTSIDISSKSESFISGIKSVFDKLTQNDLRVTETIVTPMQDIYAHGYVSFPIGNISSNELKIDKGNKFGGLFVSSTGEKTALTSQKRIRAVLAIVGMIVGALLIILNNATIKPSSESDKYEISSFNLTIWPYIWLALAYCLSFFILKFGRTFNRFIRLKQQVNLSKSTIDTVLKRRSDLIPQLKDIVDGAAGHEANLQQAAAELRSKNDDEFTKTIFALGEAYPSLKVSVNFMQLQFELGRTEEKIAMARSFLNDSVLNYNNLRATFVGILYSPFFKKIDREK
ncbi:MAG: LemA family protein [Acidimicrobiia bacterium]|nr:LemA family protein [Acidimicrobiia bacterium]